MNDPTINDQNALSERLLAPQEQEYQRQHHQQHEQQHDERNMSTNSSGGFLFAPPSSSISLSNHHNNQRHEYHPVDTFHTEKNGNEFDGNNDGDDDHDDDLMSQMISGGEIVVDTLLAEQERRRKQQQQQSSSVQNPQQQQRHETPGAGPPEFRDVPFAIGFIIHFLIILFLAIFWGIGSLRYTTTKAVVEDATSDIDNNNDYTVTTSTSGSYGLLWLGVLTSLAGVGFSAASLELMTRHGERLIQLCLFSSCCTMGFVVMTFLFSYSSFTATASGGGGGGGILLALFWMAMLAMTIWYVYAVWNRIPFAASNLQTAIAAIQTNYGVCLLGYALALCANAWVLIWSLAVLGVKYRESSCDENDHICEPGGMDFFSFLLMIISYYWTSEVLKNILHVTISGVVGTWWFAPQEASSLFSPAIQDSFRRSITLSFGSICMGSLLMAIIQTLQQLANMVRRQTRNSILLCLAECILFYIEAIARYFNHWAYVYVGLYGYDYLTSGEKVLQLFRERRWSVIISDNLVYRTLVLVSLVIGALSGLVGMFLAKATGWAAPIVGTTGNSSSYVLVFIMCFMIGWSMANITMSVVRSAVDTVIVSFAEAPAELHSNHPALSQQMMIAWRQVYPQECHF